MQKDFEHDNLNNKTQRLTLQENIICLQVQLWETNNSVYGHFLRYHMVKAEPDRYYWLFILTFTYQMIWQQNSMGENINVLERK